LNIAVFAGWSNWDRYLDALEFFMASYPLETDNGYSVRGCDAIPFGASLQSIIIISSGV
jgi:hypothetical protein